MAVPERVRCDVLKSTATGEAEGPAEPWRAERDDLEGEGIDVGQGLGELVFRVAEADPLATRQEILLRTCQGTTPCHCVYPECIGGLCEQAFVTRGAGFSINAALPRLAVCVCVRLCVCVCVCVVAWFAGADDLVREHQKGQRAAHALAAIIGEAAARPHRHHLRAPAATVGGAEPGDRQCT